MMWLVTLLSICGVVLNIYKKKVCFVIWAFTNATWCLYDAWHGLWPQAALFSVYFVLAIWGLLQWRRDEKGKQK